MQRSGTTPLPEVELGELTCDPILRGRLTLFQPKVGYRFSLDPLLLADFVGPAPLGRVADLGAGVGIVGLTLAKNDPAAPLTLVELQPRLAALCRKNAVHNGLAERVTVVQGDLLAASTQKQLPGAGFDLVASCPPYYPLGQGGVNPDGEEAIARHELRLPLPDLIRAARRLIGFRGRLAVVYPSNRLPELLAAMLSCGLQPTRLRLVHPHEGEPAQRVLVEAQKGARAQLAIEPPSIRTQCGRQLHRRGPPRPWGTSLECLSKPYSGCPSTAPSVLSNLGSLLRALGTAAGHPHYGFDRHS